VIGAVDEKDGSVRLVGPEAQRTACAERQRRELEASRRFPNRQIASVLAALYVAGMLVAAVLVRALRMPRPDRLLSSLAREYSAVPEMAVHKAVEIRSLLRHNYCGRGLDLGCGDGKVGGVLIGHAGLEHLEGVDVSPIDRAVLLARGYVGYVVADIQELPHPDAAFDYVIAVCVVEHIADLGSVLREAGRVLKAGGWLYFTTPSRGFREALIAYRVLKAFGMNGLAARFQSYRDMTACHLHYLEETEWRAALAEAGFSDVAIEPIFSRRQHLVYDAMNVQAYFLRYYFYERLRGALERSDLMRRAMEWATAQVAAAVTATAATRADATHYSIACCKGAASRGET